MQENSFKIVPFSTIWSRITCVRKLLASVIYHHQSSLRHSLVLDQSLFFTWFRLHQLILRYIDTRSSVKMEKFPLKRNVQFAQCFITYKMFKALCHLISCQYCLLISQLMVSSAMNDIYKLFTVRELLVSPKKISLP